MFTSPKPMTCEQVRSYCGSRTKSQRCILHVLVYGSLIFGGGFWLVVQLTKYGRRFFEHLEWSDIPIYSISGGLYGLLLWSTNEQRYAAAKQRETEHVVDANGG